MLQSSPRAPRTIEFWSLHIKDLWSEGKTVAQIAAALSKRGHNVSRKEMQRYLFANGMEPHKGGAGGKVPHRWDFFPMPKVEPEWRRLQRKRVTEEAVKATLELRDDQCRWPKGDPREGAFQYCEHKKVWGKSYCALHAYRSLSEEVVK